MYSLRTFMVSLRARYDAYPFDYILIQVEKGLAVSDQLFHHSVYPSTYQHIGSRNIYSTRVSIHAHRNSGYLYPKSKLFPFRFYAIRVWYSKCDRYPLLCSMC